MTSVVFCSIISDIHRGIANVTSPAPLLSAATEAKYAAPLNPTLPAMIKTLPHEDLFIFFRRFFMPMLSSVEISDVAYSFGTPISATVIFLY